MVAIGSQELQRLRCRALGNGLFDRGIVRRVIFLGGSKGEMMYHIRDARMSPAECSDKSCIWWLGGQMIAASNVWIDITMSPTKEAGFRCRKNFLVRGPLGGATKKLQPSTP